jgi:hypothetical protein
MRNAFRQEIECGLSRNYSEILRSGCDFSLNLSIKAPVDPGTSLALLEALICPLPLAISESIKELGRIYHEDLSSIELRSFRDSAERKSPSVQRTAEVPQGICSG